MQESNNKESYYQFITRPTMPLKFYIPYFILPIGFTRSSIHYRMLLRSIIRRNMQKINNKELYYQFITRTTLSLKFYIPYFIFPIGFTRSSIHYSSLTLFIATQSTAANTHVPGQTAGFLWPLQTHPHSWDTRPLPAMPRQNLPVPRLPVPVFPFPV